MGKVEEKEMMLVGHLTGKRPINQSDITRTRLVREDVLSAVGIILND